jgi:uncharacterized protein (DUF433 family)
VNVQIESLATPDNWLDRIVVDPTILPGQPIIKGTRIAAEELVS